MVEKLRRALERKKASGREELSVAQRMEERRPRKESELLGHLKLWGITEAGFFSSLQQDPLLLMAEP